MTRVPPDLMNRHSSLPGTITNGSVSCIEASVVLALYTGPIPTHELFGGVGQHVGKLQRLTSVRQPTDLEPVRLPR